jgi:hypothetical protein
MALMGFMTEDPDKPPRGVIEIESMPVPYVDLRGAAAPMDALERFIAETVLGNSPAPGLVRGLVVTLPQAPDALGLNLARLGIRLIAGTEPLPTLLDRFRQHIGLLGAAGSSRGGGTTTGAGGPGVVPPSGRRPRSESPFAQRPPWFDQTAFDQRIRQLQQPWRDEDAWKSES